ncbi:MAG TPA: tyrosine-type recombinase/integrase, partial [Sedimentisphaerales bacterium]|nr:tyrosine-type recombinase/integrase [Sedimentisphaerales bacterium]
LYRLAAETGQRRDELKSLKKSSFDFENLTVTVEAGYTKNKKPAVLPLRKDTRSMALTKNLQKNPTLIVIRCLQLALVKSNTRVAVSKTVGTLSLCKW